MAWNDTFGFDPFPRELNNSHIDRVRCSSCQLEYFQPPYYGDADFYSKISKHPWYYEQNKWEYDVAAEIVSELEPESLLEIGCGNGHFLEKIKFSVPSVEGIDINKDAVASCKEKGLSVDAINIFDLKKSYDAVVLFQVLEHMENAKELFEHITNNLLRPDGYLIVAVPNPDGYLAEMGDNLMDMPPHHNSRWSLKTFEYLQAHFGLQMVEYKKEPIRYVHYLGLLQSFVSGQVKISTVTWKSSILRKLQSLVIRLGAPLTYLRDREQIVGQTHLAVFKNVR